MTAWRAAMRLARRDALRHKWRSLLIVVLILAPVGAATGVDILYRTQTSAAAEREEVFGGADARISEDYNSTRRYPTLQQVAAALPTGSRVVPAPLGSEMSFARPGYLSQATVLLTDDLGDPMVRNAAELTSGQAPKQTDEVAISSRLAERLGLADPEGSRISVRLGKTEFQELTVTGVVRNPFCLTCPLATATRTSALAEADTNLLALRGSSAYLVDLPEADEKAGPGRFGRLHELGVQLTMRHDYGGYQLALTDLRRASGEDLKAVALVTLVAGLGLLEVVLLAGTAFAVGARRQTRDLGMISAQGGSPRDLRRVVLAQGVLLGLIGAVAGVLAGFGTVLAAKPLLERVNNEVMVGIHYGAVEIAVVAAVGLFSGLAAALIPAVAASRRRTIDALAARFPVPTARSRRGPLLGVALIGIGGAIGLYASYSMNGNETPVFRYGGDDVVYAGGGGTDGALAILVGVFIVVAGLLLVTPALLAALARAAGRLPITLRLATRDAARHRHRTGPATAAIAVAVGGAVAISCLIASEQEGTDRFEADSMPDRVIALTTEGAVDGSQIAVATEEVKKLIPGAQVLPISVPQTPPDPGAVDNYPSLILVESYGSDGPRVGIGNPDLVVLASGRVADRDAAAAALDAGKAVVFDADLLDAANTIGVGTGRFDEAAQRSEIVRIPAVVLPRAETYNGIPQAFVPRSFVTEQGLDTAQTTTLLSYPPEARSQAGAAIAIAEQLGIPVTTSAQERDYTRLVRVGLAAAAALIALLGVAMCVALSAAEGRPDLATLSAIGAPPSRRRRLAGAQALVLGGLGSVLGLAFGFYFAHAARPTTGATETVVPWGDLMVTVAAVPLLAVLVAYAGSVGRVSLTRRVD